MKGGKTSEAMTDFTGGVVEHYELNKVPEDLFAQMQKSEKRSSLMSCSIKVRISRLIGNTHNCTLCTCFEIFVGEL